MLGWLVKKSLFWNWCEGAEQSRPSGQKVLHLYRLPVYVQWVVGWQGSVLVTRDCFALVWVGVALRVVAAWGWIGAGRHRWGSESRDVAFLWVVAGVGKVSWKRVGWFGLPLRIAAARSIWTIHGLGNGLFADLSDSVWNGSSGWQGMQRYRVVWAWYRSNPMCCGWTGRLWTCHRARLQTIAWLRNGWRTRLAISLESRLWVYTGQGRLWAHCSTRHIVCMVCHRSLSWGHRVPRSCCRTWSKSSKKVSPTILSSTLAQSTHLNHGSGW